VLPAALTNFKILDSQSDPTSCRPSTRTNRSLRHGLAIPNYRLQATDKTVITFRERPAGQPEALARLVLPGPQLERRVRYPKAKAMELGQRPPTFRSCALRSSSLGRSRDDQITGAPVRRGIWRRAPIRAIGPTGEEVQLAQAVTPPPQRLKQPRQRPSPARRARCAGSRSSEMLDVLRRLRPPSVANGFSEGFVSFRAARLYRRPRDFSFRRER